jgi:hypothetical protein
MSISVGLRLRSISDTNQTARPTGTPTTSQLPARWTSGLDAQGGTLRRGSLRFSGNALERQYQFEAGAESLTGFRITTGAAAVIWLLAAVIIPTGTSISVEQAFLVCSAVGLLNWAAFVMSDHWRTLDRQHATLSFLTSVNGLVILWLASTGGVLAGYGISAIMLLFAFGFVSRTAFVFAASRSAIISVGFVVAAIVYRGPGSLLVDAFIFAAAVVGSPPGAATPRAVATSRVLPGHSHQAPSRRHTT